MPLEFGLPLRYFSACHSGNNSACDKFSLFQYWQYDMFMWDFLYKLVCIIIGLISFIMFWNILYGCQLKVLANLFLPISMPTILNKQGTTSGSVQSSSLEGSRIYILKNRSNFYILSVSLRGANPERFISIPVFVQILWS